MKILLRTGRHHARRATQKTYRVHVDVAGGFARRRRLIYNPAPIQTQSGHRRDIRLRSDLARPSARQVIDRHVVILEHLVQNAGTVRQPARKIVALQNLPRVRPIGVHQP